MDVIETLENLEVELNKDIEASTDPEEIELLKKAVTGVLDALEIMYVLD